MDLPLHLIGGSIHVDNDLVTTMLQISSGNFLQFQFPKGGRNHDPVLNTSIEVEGQQRLSFYLPLGDLVTSPPPGLIPEKDTPVLESLSCKVVWLNRCLLSTWVALLPNLCQTYCHL